MNLRAALFAALLLVPSVAGAQAAGPQTGLSTTKITFTGHGGAPHTFTVELAATPQQQEVGLMFRRSVPEGQGMLFDWGFARDVPMWMKNTLIPLDMVFIGADGTVIHIAEDTVPESLAQISSGGPVRATLEVGAGVTEKLDIRVGDKVQGAMFK
jgi:uncharacterized membrane protein (UPF0127 family)